MLKKLLTLFWLLCLLSDSHAAPKAEAWSYWNTSQTKQSFDIDHSLWQGFLQRYLKLPEDGISRMKYAAVSQQDRRSLSSYLDYLQQLPVRQMTRNQQLAYWINLYNAGTVKIILDHFPVDSILDIDISPGLFSNGPWGEKLFIIDGQHLSLDDIEHRILRPLWRDPRIHYAVNCASQGCPNLQATPFTQANIEQRLELAAKTFINHPRGVSFRRDSLIASSIYHWFEADFGGDEAGVITHLKRYAAGPLLERLEQTRGIDDYTYDWRLNRID